MADLLARSSQLSPTTIAGEVIPRAIDELPVLALAAAFAGGDTIIRDAAELRVKESDRIHATCEQLGRLGALLDETPDGMVIHGGSALRGAATESDDDHRLAMTLAVAGLVASGETSVGGADSVDISYPGFFEDLGRIVAKA